MLRRVTAILLCLCALLRLISAAAEESGDPLAPFILHHGDRGSKKIAITVDDCYKTARDWVRRDAELCRKYGVAMTFFPLVHTGCMGEKNRDLWQEVLDSGCEIGTLRRHWMRPWAIITRSAGCARPLAP